MPTLVSSGDITISDINDGLSAQLSKESHIVPTDSDGSNPDFTGCQTTISVFLGSIDDSLNWTIVASPSAGLTGSLNVRTYTVTALTGSVGYVDLIASKVGFPSITARFTVTKLADGANGTRIAVLEMYQWAASAPTSFPDGTSTYTWATGTFTAPTTPNGWTLIPGAPVAGQTLWGISVVVSNTETTAQSIVDWDSNVVYAVGAAGSNGAPGTAYWLTSSVPAVQKSITGAYTPTSITYNLIQAIGSSAPSAYAGRFIIATSTDGSTYTDVYTSADIESSKSYTVPASIKTIRVRAYLAGGTTTLIDELVTTIVSDGATGTTGARGLNFSEAKILYTDLTFQTGVNGISVYNNSGGGTVTHTRVARLADSPFTDSNFNLEISNTGAASPGLGGFTHVTQTRASAIFVQRFIAKVPVGYTLSYHNNAFGTGATASWLTSNAGTGTFQEYIVEWRCGSTGTFSSIAFIALNGAVGTPEVPVKWWLASSTVYDFTAIGFATTIGVLSNESHTIPTDSSGNNGNFTGASTTLTIYNGTVDDSTNWTVTANPVNVTGTLVGKTYTVTALSADTGYVDLTATRSGFTNIVKRFSLTKSRAGVNGTDGVNGTRTAVLDVYRWSATTPTTFPSGTSTYTWATGQFTAPATLNSWSLTPPAPVLGQTLWSLRQVYADTGVSATSSITWSANTPTSLSAAGTNGSNGSNGTRTAILELYRWSATTPTTFPSGTSTYTWATGAFTAPATLNSWSLLPGASVPGQTLWGCSVAYSDQLTTTTSSVTWNTSTAYAVGAAGSNALQISVVATQWDYRDDDAIWGIKINDVLQAGAARGHKLVVLNPATGVVSINQNYDTYGSEANTDSLAAAINGVADGQIVVLTTYDASSCNQNLRNALRLCGSESIETWTLQRKSHAFIGQKGLPIGAAYEKTGFGTTAAGTSKVAAYFTTSGIVRNGSTAFNAVSAILSNEAHVFPASTSGIVSSYVGSGTEIRVYDGTTLLTYDGSGTLPGTWKIATAPTNITIGTITDSGSFATVGDHSGVAEGIDTAAIIYTITGKSIINGDFTLVKVQTFTKAKAGDTGSQGPAGPAVVITANRPLTFTSTDGTLDGSQSNIILTAAVSGITSPTYVWTFSGLETNPTASITNTQTIASSNFGTSKSATVTCTVSGSYSDQVTIVRLETSTAEAGATFNDMTNVSNIGEVYNSNCAIVALDGRPAGVHAMYGTNIGSVVSYQDTAKTIVKLYSVSDASIGCAWNAFAVNPSTTYEVKIRVKASVAATTGFYFRIAELDTELPQGAVYIHNGIGEAGGVSNTRYQQFKNNSAIGTAWEDHTFTYTPTSTAKWASPYFLNWDGMGLAELHIAQVVITNKATVGAPAGTLVGGTLAETVENNASQVVNKLDKASADILNIDSASAVRMAGIRVGDIAWNSSGDRTSGKGVALTPSGMIGHNGTKTTFAINATTGDATFGGTLNVSSASGNARVEITNSSIKVYDENGKLRVHIGDLTQ